MPHVLLVAMCLLVSGAMRGAWALPSFGEQTGQSCAACHVGSYGPQLKPFGRDFKLYGYVASDGKPHFPPLAATAMASFTRTDSAQPAAPAPGFARNNNFAFDEGSFYYAGRITETVGAFIETNYDGVGKRLSVGKLDVRHTRESELFDSDLVFGVTLNNQPAVADLWNSTPAWGFPYNASKLAPTPMAAALVEGGAGQQVMGAGGYALWNDLLYVELAAYQPMGPGLRNALGVLPYYGADRVADPFPYWRLAVQQQIGNHFVQLGTYGMQASVYPGNDRSAGRANKFLDVAVDLNWQWIADPKSVVSDMVSAHATWIRETSTLAASQVLAGSRATGRLDVMRADVSYSLGATWTPTVQVFRTSGRADSAYYGTPSGRPNSSGMVFEMAYVPFGKPDSWTDRFNVRIAAQYVSYFEFNGTSKGASANNALYLSLWSALRF